MLRKREAFRKAFAGFDPAKVARFTETDVARLMNDAGIIRASAKIEATIAGARIFCEMRDRGEDFARSAGRSRRAGAEGNGRTFPAQTELSGTSRRN